MTARPNWRIIEIELAQADRYASRAELELCRAVVARWNEMVRPLREDAPSPSIGTCLLVGQRWLGVMCQGCGTASAVDLQTLAGAARRAVGGLKPALRCRHCGARGRQAKLLGVRATRAEAMTIPPRPDQER